MSLKNILPLLEEMGGKRYPLTSLLQILKDIESLDSVKIMKIRNLLVPVNDTITISDIESVFLSLGSDRKFMDEIISKLEKHGISDQ